MSGLIFGLPSRLPASTALLSPGQIRLPLQEQINSIAKCCGVLRGLTEHQLSHAPETKAMPHEQALGEFIRQQLRPLARDGLLSRETTTKRYFGWTFGLPPGLPGGGITGVLPASGVGAFIPLSMSGGQITP